MTEYVSILENYALYGLKTIPVIPKSKLPVETKYQKKGRDPLQMIPWIEKGYNIGIITGKSSNILIMDIDGTPGIDSLAELNHNIDEINTFTVKSGREKDGFHLYFRTNQDFGIRTKMLPGIDILTNGKHAVAPPSIHPDSGEEYTIYNKIEPQPLPDWLHELLTEKKNILAEKKNKSAEKLHKQTFNSYEGEEIPQGQRNSTLFHIGSALRGTGGTDSQIENKLTEVNDHYCKPPLLLQELKNIIKSVCKYEAGNGITSTL